MSHQRLHEIRKEVERGNVSERTVDELSLFKYTKQCQYDNAWNRTNKRCRGIIFNTITGTIVNRPFDKFFNMGERPNTMPKVLRSKLKHGVEAYDKLDGSCISIFYYDGRWRCSTPGSITSPQAKYAEMVLLLKYDLSKLPTDLTYVCEMVAPFDRQDKVVDYGSRNDLTLLAAFEKKWDQTEVPRGRLRTLFADTGIELAPMYPLDSEDPFGTKVPDGKEGFVLLFHDGLRVKVKGRWYKHWARIISGITLKNVAELLEVSDDDSVRKELTPRGAPPEIKENLDDTIAEVNLIREEVEEEVDKWWIQAEDYTDFKACAEIFKQAGPVRHILFARMRGNKDGEQRALWSRVKDRICEKNKALASHGEDNQEESEAGS